MPPSLRSPEKKRKSAPTTPKASPPKHPRTPKKNQARTHKSTYVPVNIPKGAQLVSVADISPLATGKQVIKVRVMDRSNLTAISDSQQLFFSAVVADQTGDLKITFYDAKAERWNDLVKKGAILKFCNLEFGKNKNTGNYTSHEYEARCQKFTYVGATESAELEDLEPRLYMKQDRDFFHIAMTDEKTVFKKQKTFVTYDVAGIVFKITESTFENEGKIVPKLEAHVTNGTLTVKESILGGRVDDFKGLFDAPTLEKLTKGIRHITAEDAKSLFVLFRSNSPKHFDGVSLQLHSKQGFMALFEVPRDVLELCPLDTNNIDCISETFLDWGMDKEFQTEVSDLTEGRYEGSFLVSGYVSLVPSPRGYTYMGVPEDAKLGTSAVIDNGGPEYYSEKYDRYFSTYTNYFLFEVQLSEKKNGKGSFVVATVFNDVGEKLLKVTGDRLCEMLDNNEMEEYERVLNSMPKTKVQCVVEAVLEDKKKDDNGDGYRKMLYSIKRLAIK